VKPDANSICVHPQLSYNGLPMDSVLVAIGFTQFEALNFKPASFSKRSWAMNTWPEAMPKTRISRQKNP